MNQLLVRIWTPELFFERNCTRRTLIEAWYFPEAFFWEFPILTAPSKIDWLHEYPVLSERGKVPLCLITIHPWGGNYDVCRENIRRCLVRIGSSSVY